jgi:hypothetical protein
MPEIRFLVITLGKWLAPAAGSALEKHSSCKTDFVKHGIVGDKRSKASIVSTLLDTA